MEGDRLVFTVRDHGPGIPPADLERIFEPFYTTRPTGTGLGLAVAQRIVQMHGGTLTAANDPGGGASFRMAIPRA
jgi:signal transduction histidine kinase